MTTVATKEMIQRFLLWEKASQDTIDFKMCYVDMAEDILAGLLLSQIVYWYLPSKKRSEAESKLRVKRDGVFWIAKGRDEWYEEIRLSPKQFDRASKILVEKGLIEKKVMKFAGETKVHVRLIWGAFLESINETISNETFGDMGFPQRVNQEFPFGEIGNSPLGKSGIPQRGIPYTESTTKSTAKSTTENPSIRNPEINAIIETVFPKGLKNDWIDSIYTVYDSFSEEITLPAYKRVLKEVKKKTTNIRSNFENYLKTAVKNEIEPKQSATKESTTKPVREEIKPDWWSEEEKQVNDMIDIEKIKRENAIMLEMIKQKRSGS